MEHLQAFIGDCDKRTELAKQRLLETQEELSAEVSVKANHVHQLAEEIGKKLARAEQLGEEGFVEESLKLMGEVSCSIEYFFSQTKNSLLSHQLCSFTVLLNPNPPEIEVCVCFHWNYVIIA